MRSRVRGYAKRLPLRWRLGLLFWRLLLLLLWCSPRRRPSGRRPSGRRPSGQCPSGRRPSGRRPSGRCPSGGRPSGRRPNGRRLKGWRLTARVARTQPARSVAPTLDRLGDGPAAEARGPTREGHEPRARSARSCAGLPGRAAQAAQRGSGCVHQGGTLRVRRCGWAHPRLSGRGIRCAVGL